MTQSIQVAAAVLLGTLALSATPTWAADKAAVKKVLAGQSCERCDLTGANLRGQALLAALDNADLTRANLTGADMAGASLAHADLTSAKLNEAYAVGAKLNGADLTKADLTGANFTNANLTGADLTGAILAGADFSGATWVDGSKCDKDSFGACKVVGVAKPLP